MCDILCDILLCEGYILLHNMAIWLPLIVSEAIIRDRGDELMEAGLCLCIIKIGSFFGIVYSSQVIKRSIILS